MIASDLRFRPNEADVAAKVIDGEAIIMNLSNGLYFSMDGTGAALWELMEAGHSVHEMVDGLAGRFDGDRDRIEADARELLGRLVEEGLILEAESADAPTAPAPAQGREPYVAPVLNRYDDMADLLALDPPMPGLGALPEE